eukprot:750748-Hanusia_phi.AAC.2
MRQVGSQRLTCPFSSQLASLPSSLLALSSPSSSLIRALLTGLGLRSDSSAPSVPSKSGSGSARRLLVDLSSSTSRWTDLPLVDLTFCRAQL